MEGWIMDLRYSGRRLSRRPAYAVLAVVTLALGVGGTAAIFAVARPLLLDPLPVEHEHEVGVFWMDGSWNEQEFLHLRPDFPGFAHVAAYRQDGTTLEMPGEPLRLVQATSASAELFDVLGRRALMGRAFEPGDDRPGGEPVVVLSHGFWQELGGEASTIGRQFRLGGVDRTVVGVMPPDFWFPTPTTRAWLVRSLNPERQVGELSLVGRVAPGVTLDNLSGPLAALGTTLGERFTYPEGEWDKLRAPAVTPLREHLVGNVQPAIAATFMAVLLILTIACVNVAALMLGQLTGRNTELATRAALGAGRQRLMQQVVAESLVIGALSGGVGALLAVSGFEVLVRSLPLGALAEAASLDWTLFLAALVIAVVAAAAVGLVPGIAMWRANLQAAIATTRTAGISGRGGRLESGLVVAQIALAVLLAAGAGLLLQSVANLRAIDPGIDVSAVAAIDATVPGELGPLERRQAYLDALRALESVPGARQVAAAQRIPLLGSSDNWGFGIDGRADVEGAYSSFRIVSHDYLDVMGIEVRRGRGFTPGDRERAERVVLINERFARRYFPDADPIGRVLHTGFDEQGERIIGIVNDVAENGLTDPLAPARYMLYEQLTGGFLSQTTFVVRTDSPGETAAVAQAVRAALQRDAPRLAVHNVTTMQAVFDRALGPAGQVVTLVTLLAALALVLGAIGVYGAIAHFVTRRSRDYGIQIALGLRPGRLVSQVLARGLGLAAAGCAVGVGAALMLTRLLASLLYGVGAADALALGGAVLALLAVGAAAALIPALRASRTDPLTALREA